MHKSFLNLLIRISECLDFTAKEPLESWVDIETSFLGFLRGESQVRHSSRLFQSLGVWNVYAWIWNVLDSFVLTLAPHPCFGIALLNPNIKGSRLVTQTQFLPNWALFTLDYAAPVETAETVFLQDHCLVPVTPLATQKVTSAHV